MTQMTATQALGAFAAGLTDIPEAVRSRVITHLVYNTGLARASAGAPRVQMIHDAALQTHGRVTEGGATLFLSGSRTSAVGAAFGNAILFGAGGRGDTLGTLHVGQTAIPALLAAIEAYDLPLERLVPALVVAYEVGGRLDRLYGEDLARVGFRSTPINGAIAAAAATSHILGLDAAQAASAIAIASCTTGGILQPFEDGSEEPGVQSGLAAQLGVTAAVLARTGVRGAAHALEGPFGLVRAAAQRELVLSELLEGLGKVWLTEQVTYKPFPSCAFAQTPVHAGLAMRPRIAGGEIRRLEILLNPQEAAYAGLNFTGPFSTLMETTMSAPFSVVHGLVFGTPIRQTDLLKFSDPAMTDILSRTELRGDAKVPPLSTIVTAEMADGRTIVHEQIMTASDYSLPLAEVREMVIEALSWRQDADTALPAFERFMEVAKARFSPGDVSAFFGVAEQNAVASEGAAKAA